MAPRTKNDAGIEMRLAKLESNQAAILACLKTIAGQIEQLSAKIAGSTFGNDPPEISGQIEDPLIGDDEPLIDVVWDAFAFNADAYAFWHTPHPALGNKAPKAVAQDKKAQVIIRQLIAQIRAER